MTGLRLRFSSLRIYSVVYLLKGTHVFDSTHEILNFSNWIFYFLNILNLFSCNYNYSWGALLYVCEC